MQAKKILVRLLLLAGFISLFFIISYRENIRQFLNTGFFYSRARTNNIFSDSEVSLERRLPLSTVEREAQLQLYVGEPFKSFVAEDWKYFWHIAYGVFSKEKKRQLSEKEISVKLINLYPDIFSKFQENNWKMFFGIIFNK